jgi:hypothetical protein
LFFYLIILPHFDKISNEPNHNKETSQGDKLIEKLAIFATIDKKKLKNI